MMMKPDYVRRPAPDPRHLLGYAHLRFTLEQMHAGVNAAAASTWLRESLDC